MEITNNRYRNCAQDFSVKFRNERENKAIHDRGLFIRLFPIQELKNITLDDYVIGKGTKSFCSMVEAKTRAWANIQGSTSNKFGIYFGKTKNDPTKKYRFTKKFGSNQSEAFLKVKSSLLDLIDAGTNDDFEAIDKNPLSQLFKAKILSLYFPHKFINICSKDHLLEICDDIGLPENKFVSWYQAKLIELKNTDHVTASWSNPKYMTYLYAVFNNELTEILSEGSIVEPKNRTHRRVNFKDIVENQNKIGALSEKYALEWEQNRLLGLGYEALITEIIDCRDRPGFGYDFQSFSSKDVYRYIEVKSVGRNNTSESYRFFLSENEKHKSMTGELSNEYYFYLVFYGKDGNPSELKAILANDLYTNSSLQACAFKVYFDVKDLS